MCLCVCVSVCLRACFICVPAPLPSASYRCPKVFQAVADDMLVTIGQYSETMMGTVAMSFVRSSEQATRLMLAMGSWVGHRAVHRPLPAQVICRVAWSLVHQGVYVPEFFEHLHAGFHRLEPFLNRTGRMQLLVTSLALQHLSPMPHFALPEWFITQCRSMELEPTCRMAFAVFQTAQVVCDEDADLPAPMFGYMSPEGLPIQIAFPDAKVAIHVLRAKAYAHTRPSPRLSMQTALTAQLHDAMGWTLLTVPFWEWTEVAPDRRMEYVHTLLAPARDQLVAGQAAAEAAEVAAAEAHAQAEVAKAEAAEAEAAEAAAAVQAEASAVGETPISDEHVVLTEDTHK